MASEPRESRERAKSPEVRSVMRHSKHGSAPNTRGFGRPTSLARIAFTWEEKEQREKVKQDDGESQISQASLAS